MVLNFLQNLFNPGPRFEIFKPRFQVASPVPVPVIIDNRQQIRFLQSELKTALKFFRETFPKPVFNLPVFRGCRHPSCFRGPNVLGSLQRRGNILGIDPFSGFPVVTGTSFRSTIRDPNQLRQIALNRARGIFGTNLKMETQAFIGGIRTEIGLLSTEQTV